MVRITFWLFLLLLDLVLRQSDAVSDNCNELQNEIYGLEGNRLKLIKEMEYRKEILGLNEQLEAKEKFLNLNTEALKQMQTTITGLRKIEETNKRTIQELTEKQQQLQTTIDELTKTVETKKRAVEFLCGPPDDVACLYLLDAVISGDVNSVKRWASCTIDNCTSIGYLYSHTPLVYAVVMGHVEVVQVLLEFGAKTEITDVNNATAMHAAAWSGNPDVCRLLLDWGAKVDPVDTQKDTPLHYAARRGHLSVLKLLVERGTDVRLENKNGQTASDVARLWEWKAAADWLDSISRG